MSRRRRVKFDCSFWDDAKLPPCANFLGDYNPLIKDGKPLYRNYNRLYMFLSYTTAPLSSIVYNPCDPSTYTVSSNGNIQISIYDFIIGLYLDLLYREKIEYNEDVKIHEDARADRFIKSIRNVNNDEIKESFIPSLSYSISNSNAIMPLYTSNFNISPTTFYIILMLNRFSGDLSLLWANNSYVTPDRINYELAALVGKR